MDIAAVDSRATKAAAGSVLPAVSSALDSLAPAALAAGTLLPGLLSLVFGGVIAARRLAGAAPAAPGPAAILLACAVGTVLVWLASLVSRLAMEGRPTGARLARLGLLVSLAAVALPPRLSSTADGVALAVATACAAVAILRGVAARSPERARPHRLPTVSAAVRPQGASTPSSSIREGSPAGFPPGAPPGAADDDEGLTGTGCLVQRFERRVLTDGSECVRGRLHVMVPAGARLGAGHVGFCPPLSAAPTVQVSTDYDAVEAIVIAAEVLPWGARIECRLDEPAEEAIRVPVDLSARAPS